VAHRQGRSRLWRRAPQPGECGNGLLTATIFAAILVAPLPAFAADDVESLAKQLQQDYSELSTQDCAIACKAYASIRRAADKICDLEAGPRCIEAKTKADDAQRRVQAACPDCQLAAKQGKEDDRRASEYTESKPATKAGADSESAPRKGGCASCNTPGERPTGDLGIAVIGALVLARVLRRRSFDRPNSPS